MRFGLFCSKQANNNELGPETGQGFRDYLDFNVEAEALDYHSSFSVEHHFTGWNQASATLTLLTCLAMRTTTLRLGTAVMVLPWHNPVLLAEQAATLDLISDGRLDFGIGNSRIALRAQDFCGTEKPMPRYANLLFDLDGTITDPKISITACINYVLATLDVRCPPQSELDWCIGPPLPEIFGRLLESSDTTLINRAVDLYLARYEVEGFRATTVYPGVEDLLKELKKQGCRLFLATAKLGDHGQLVLAHFGLLQFFSAAYGTLLEGSVRTKSQLVRSVLSREHLEPLMTAMIGDRAQDMIAARENGVAAIGVGYGYGTRSELEAAGADAIFGSLKSLSTFLSGDS